MIKNRSWEDNWIGEAAPWPWHKREITLERERETRQPQLFHRITEQESDGK